MENRNNKLHYIQIMSIVISVIVVYLFFTNANVRERVFKIISPIMIAFSIAYMLDTAAKFFENKLKVSRGKSIALVLVILLMFVIYLGAIAIPNLVNNISEFLNIIPEKYELNTEAYDQFVKDIDNEYVMEINDYIQKSLEELLTKISAVGSFILKNLLSKIFQLTSSVFSGILSFVIAIYMLLDKKDLLARMKRMLYAFVDNEKCEYILYSIKKGNEIFSSFCIGKLIDSAIIGLLCFVILVIIGVPYSSIISILVGITNMIPYFGPFIGGVPAVFMTLLISPKLSIWVAVTIVALQQFDGMVLGPKILGDKVGVGAFWIIIAVTVGGATAGVLGMFLGVPVLVLIKTLLEENISKRLELKNMKDLELVHLSENNKMKKTKRLKCKK